jgi:hypothetical protein
VSSVIPHIYKYKLGKGLHFPLKYSDLESHFLSRTDRDVHLDAWFQANHPYWRAKAYRRWREEDFTLIKLTYGPRDRFRHWPPEELPNSIVVRCWVHALPDALATEVGLTRSLLRKTITIAFEKLTAGGLFNRRWQVVARLRIRERLLECATLAWEDVKPITLTNQLIDLEQEKERCRSSKS